jgi:NAD(P)-dependent dehydrogenase (short-subunit alcohol dehydrogenase family)
MDLGLEGRVAIVTGGSRGIGKAIARQLSIEGSIVAIVARHEDALAIAASEIEQESRGVVFPVVADTTLDGSVQQMVGAVHQRFGRIDILVNCAATPGGRSPSPLSEITSSVFWEDINLKVMGYLRCAQAVAPLMAKSGWGRIINISGMGARQVGSTVRSIRNAGVVALTKSLANELGPHGINVTVIHPGTTRTESTASVLSKRAAAEGVTPEEIERQLAGTNTLGRLVDAREVAYVAAFLASPASVAINGELIVASGGAGNAIYY